MSDFLALQLPAGLEEFRTDIEAAIEPYVEIKVTPDRNVGLEQSKFGGFPYFPKHLEYPRSPDGQALHLLAQINFAEVPPLENFPTQGILQFYLKHDTFYGCDFDNPTHQTGFRVLYFPEIEWKGDRLLQDFSFLGESDDLPLEGGTFALEFIEKLSIAHPAFDAAAGKFISREALEKLQKEKGLLEMGTEEGLVDEKAGHRLGGYPYFTQRDPRKQPLPGEEPYILLFQMDSEGDYNIYWGDMGIGNFFIKESALKQLDFSDVFYNWDCC